MGFGRCVASLKAPLEQSRQVPGCGLSDGEVYFLGGGTIVEEGKQGVSRLCRLVGRLFIVKKGRSVPQGRLPEKGGLPCLADGKRTKLSDEVSIFWAK